MDSPLNNTTPLVVARRAAAYAWSMTRSSF
jgi:hypothetical protein